MKRFFVLLGVLLFVSLAYSLSQAATMRSHAAALKREVSPALTLTVTTTATQTATLARCVIATGVQDGRVNLRSCAGLACGVVSTLTEGQPITVLQPGTWAQVRTGAGVTGYLNSKLCK